MITACRVCHSTNLTTVLDLGYQALTGIFPASADQPVPVAALQLMWCQECTLVQLADSCDPAAMYGDNYGYRSGLNRAMVKHLAAKAAALEQRVKLRDGDVVLDIGSNDGTLLGCYPASARKIGIDPTSDKFAAYYQPGIERVAEFFTAERFHQLSDTPARIITSIAMFYDLDDPVAFARDVRDCLAINGVWHLEHSYLPTMLDQTSYDMACHEHLEYYSVTSIARILNEAGLEIVDITFNNVNGGSFAVTAIRNDSAFLVPADRLIAELLEDERYRGLHTPAPFEEFEHRVFGHRDALRNLIADLRADGKTVMGYGASTKGNVILQLCKFEPDDISAIAEVNETKFGCVTPGTHIPIISETEMRAAQPDYLLVLPWHFRDGIIERESEYLERGGHLIFPLPEIEIVGA